MGATCPSCGSAVEGDAAECPSCGRSLVTVYAFLSSFASGVERGRADATADTADEEDA